MADQPRKPGRGRPPLFSNYDIKRRRAAYAKTRRATFVRVGTSYDKWESLRKKNGWTSEEMASRLVDRYQLVASTPILHHRLKKGHFLGSDASLSSISEDRTSVAFSNVHELISQVDSVSSASPVMMEVDAPEIVNQTTELEDLRISVDTTFIDDGAVYDDKDITYCPDVDIYLHDPKYSNAAAEREDVDVIFDIDEEPEEPEPADEPEDRPMDREAVMEKVYLSYLTCLLDLAAISVDSECQRCGTSVVLKTTNHSSAIILKWICENGHLVKRWCSQPSLARGALKGNMALSSALFLSGNNYVKIALMCKFLNLGIPSAATFHRNQGKYIIPAITTYWESIQRDTFQRFQGRSVILAGDGRNDSPGHCAKYCTYTMMETETKQLLDMVVIDKRETDLNSAKMEPKAFEKSLLHILAEDVDVTEIVTDAHPTISSLMKKEHPAIKHSFDMWHGGKNLGKKLAKAALEKGCKDILPWIGDVTNHFWFCARTCEGHTETLMSKWHSVLHHTVNEHEWALGKCEHEEIESEKKWLEPDSSAHRKLREIVYNPYLLRTFPHYVNFRCNGEIETLNNHILMYAAKRFAYSYPAFQARNYLAAIDYQSHVDRPYLRNKKDEIVYQRAFSKHSKRWRAWPKKVKKDYNYIPGLMVAIVHLFLDDKAQRDKILMLPTDPRRISATITPIPPPATHEIVTAQKSRFK